MWMVLDVTPTDDVEELGDVQLASDTAVARTAIGVSARRTLMSTLRVRPQASPDRSPDRWYILFTSLDVNAAPPR